MITKKSGKGRIMVLLVILAMVAACVAVIRPPAAKAATNIIPDDRKISWSPGVNVGVPGGNSKPDHHIHDL